MPPSKQFLQFIALMELVETLAARQSTESLSLRNPGGESVGRLTVEGGQVRFGIEHRGRVVVDEVFMREQPRLSVILRKILDRHTLARAERDLTLDISAIGRVSLCELTARALRKVAADCVLPSPQLRPPDTGLPQLRLLNVAFTPLELTLGAGLWGNIRHDDPAVQLYFSPPMSTQERWLLEWQPNDPGFAWPILTDQLAIRRVADVRLFGSLAHLLLPNSSTRRLRGDRASTTASLALFDEGICFLASSTRYLSLLIYDRTHIARLLTAYEEFIESDNTRRPETSGAVLLAGKVALAAGQHAASMVSGLRLASPGYAAPGSPTATPAGAATPGSAGPGDGGRPGERRSVVSLRPVAAPTGAGAAARSAGPPVPVPAKPAASPAAPTSQAVTVVMPAPVLPSDQTPPAAPSTAADSVGTPPLPADAWTVSGPPPAPSAVTIASSNTSAILALSGGGLDGSGAMRPEDPAQLSAKAVAKAPAGPAAAPTPSSPRRAPAGTQPTSGDDWLLAASELVDSSHWHAPQAQGSTASPRGGQAGSSPAPAAGKSPPTSVVTPDAAAQLSPRGVEPPGELLTSALLAATLELGQILPLLPQSEDAPTATSSERTPPAPSQAAVGGPASLEPTSAGAAAGPLAVAAVPPRESLGTAPVSSITPVAAVEGEWRPVAAVPEIPSPAVPAVREDGSGAPLVESLQRIFSDGVGPAPSVAPGRQEPVPALIEIAASAVTPVHEDVASGHPALQSVAAIGAAEVSTAEESSPSAALPSGGFHEAAGVEPRVLSPDAVAPSPGQEPQGPLAASDRRSAEPVSRGDAVAGVVRLGFPDLALLAALPPTDSPSVAGGSPAGGLAESLALLSNMAAAVPVLRPRPAAADENLVLALSEPAIAPASALATARESPELASLGAAHDRDGQTPRNGHPLGHEDRRQAKPAVDLELDDLQFRLDDWSPVRSPARLGVPEASGVDAAQSEIAEVVAEPVPAFIEPVGPVELAATEPPTAAHGESIGAELDRLLDLSHSEFLASRDVVDVVPEVVLSRTEPDAPGSDGLPDSEQGPSLVQTAPAPPPEASEPVESMEIERADTPDVAEPAAAQPADAVTAPDVATVPAESGPSAEIAGEPVEAVLPTLDAASPAPPPEGEPSGPSVAQETVSVVPAPISTAPADDSDAQPPLLSLDHFTARVDGRTVLKDVTFSLERRGVYAIMGPGGSGKSSLLGILGGANRQTGGWTFTGTCTFDGRPLGDGPRPTAIPQLLYRTSLPVGDYLRSGANEPVTDAQLLAMLQRVRLSRLAESLHTDTQRIQPPLGDGEWWLLAIARALLRNPPLLGIDEPTAGLSDVEAALILDVLKAEGLRRTVVFVTHNQQHARVISHRMMLLAGGRLQESETTEVFFCGPKSRAGQDYVRTGGCYVPSPDSPNEALSDEFQAGPVLLPVAPVEPVVDAAPPPVVAAPPVDLLQEAESLWALPAEGVAGAALSLRRFSLRVGNRTILHDLSFDIGPRGLYVLSVPDGMAKRMLVRALCGPRPANFHMAGQARYGRAELSDDNSPSTPQAGAQLLMMSVAGYLSSGLAERSLSRPEQRAESIRLIGEAGFPELLPRLEIDMTSVEPAERRVLEILRAATTLPAVVVLDEPLAGLPVDQRERVIAVLRQQAKQRAVLILSQDAAAATDLKALHGWLRDGRTTTVAPPPPEPEPAPAPAPEAPAVVESPAATTASEAALVATVSGTEPATAQDPQARRFSGRGPRGFQWLRLGALAGMPAPGLANELAYDLDLIRSTGLSWLVTLTHDPLPAEEVARHGLRNLQFPVIDMDVPTEEAAARLCSQVAELVASGQAVGFHCKAGLGRTGTMLACQLIWEGTAAPLALQQVRAVEPGWIQSEKQVVFLGRFEEWLKQNWPMEGGQRKKRKIVPDVHQSSNQGAPLTAKKEKANDPT